jgi:hypothetical protein
MSKRQLHKLSAREAETIAEPGRHGDGGGLYLVIEAGAHRRRQWIFLYRVRGTSKRKELGLGPAKGKGKDGLSLADARLRAAEARKKLAEGKDPAAERRAEKIAHVTFGEFADALLQSIKYGFKAREPTQIGNAISKCVASPSARSIFKKSTRRTYSRSCRRCG